MILIIIFASCSVTRRRGAQMGLETQAQGLQVSALAIRLKGRPSGQVSRARD